MIVFEKSSQNLDSFQILQGEKNSHLFVSYQKGAK